MFAPCSANVRATSSSSRGRSHESTAIWTRKLFADVAPSHVDRREPLRVPPQRLHVRAVLAVDRDALAERDVADDRVARHRRAALREPDEHVRRRPARRRPCPRRRPCCAFGALVTTGASSATCSVFRRWIDLVDDRARLQLPRAEREVEVLGLLEARRRGSPARARPSRAASRTAGSAPSAPARAPRGPSAPSSSRVSRENHWRILLRARELFASDSQSRDGPRPCFEVRISTKSPFFSGSAAGRSGR